jgi:hypothetical protein
MTTFLEMSELLSEGQSSSVAIGFWRITCYHAAVRSVGVLPFLVCLDVDIRFDNGLLIVRCRGTGLET